ncbi:MAG: M15 family metallopeptidase [Pseudomonadota bacterium]
MRPCLILRAAPQALMSLLLALPQTASASPPPSSQPARGVELDLAAHPELVDMQSLIPDLQLDIKYATTDNFTGQNLYGDFRRCVLHREAADRLLEADRWLRQHHPELRLLVHDCLRPRSVQWRMWNVVKGTPMQGYVADPSTRTGSLHNYGVAVDLSLAGVEGTPVDMGTPYDFLGKKAEPRHENRFLADGTLSPEQVRNRLILRTAMVHAGFRPINSEWWHFEAMSARQVHKRARLVE